MANRYNRKRRGSLLTVEEVYRQPVGPASDPKSLYALLLRFVAWRRERNWSETTLKVQTHHSYRFILWAAERGLHHPAEITRPVLERYQRHLYQYRKRNGEPLTTRTQRTAVQPVQVWFRWMTQQNLILANPAADLELPRLEKRLPRYILSVAEVEQVLAQPDLTTPGGIRDRALMEVLWSTGIRRSEAAGLEVFSVDANRRILTIVQGKGKQDRVVPVGERALWWVQRYLHHVRPQLLVNPHCKALFVALDGVEGLGPNGITSAVSHYMKASGLVAHGSCHLFRHAMATQMLENGADLRWIQAMLGHASVESTQIYTQVSVRALQAVHASTHPAEREEPDPLQNPVTEGINSGESRSADVMFSRLSEKYRQMAKGDNTPESHHNDNTSDTTGGDDNEQHHPLQNRRRDETSGNAGGRASADEPDGVDASARGRAGRRRTPSSEQ